MTREYEDDYPTCAATDALLRIFSEHVSPDEMTRVLGVAPTSSVRKGHLRNPREPRSESKTNCWYLGSRDSVQSKDCRRHIDWIVERIYPAKEALRQLREAGAEISICCTWESSENQGGPIMTPKQMGPLSELGIPVWWEFWCSGGDETP